MCKVRLATKEDIEALKNSWWGEPYILFDEEAEVDVALILEDVPWNK